MGVRMALDGAGLDRVDSDALSVVAVPARDTALRGVVNGVVNGVGVGVGVGVVVVVVCEVVCAVVGVVEVCAGGVGASTAATVNRGACVVACNGRV